jgi:hypothetical protein
VWKLKEVVDGHNFHIGSIHGSTKYDSTNTPESIDANPYHGLSFRWGLAKS